MPANNVTSEQIKIFRSLFSGRDDAYGLETPQGSIAIREPLTDSIFLNHINGSKRIGTYPILQGDLVKWAVIDIDEEKDLPKDEAVKKSKEEATKLYVTCLENNLFCYLEKSKARGFHIWIFLDQPLPAMKIRTALLKILKNVNLDCEIFPKQETLTSDNGLGNFVYLPINGESKKEGRTLFLNAQFNPYEDQWEHLSKIHRTKAETILSLAEKIQEEPKSQNQKVETPAEGTLNLAKYLIHYNIPFKIKQDSNRTFYLLNQCFFADNHTTKDNLGDSSIVQDASGKLTYQCFHGHCKGRKWEDARKAISGDDSLSQFCQGYSQNRDKRNLTEDVRAWVQNAFSKFTTEQVYRDLGVSTTNDKAHVRVELGRLVTKGIIDRGLVNGSFIKVECQSSEIQIKAEVPVPLSVKLPGGLHEQVSIYHKNLMVGAGSSNAGKTAYALNTAYENRKNLDVWYFTTEMDSDELTLRVHGFGYPISEWDRVKFRPWESFHSIKPDAFNILDYLEVQEGEFWRVGDNLRKIFEKLQGGIALVFIQMDKGRQFGWGGQKTVDKARLYFTLDDNKLTIVKGKNWKGKANPNGKSITFNLFNGAKFVWDVWS